MMVPTMPLAGSTETTDGIMAQGCNPHDEAIDLATSRAPRPYLETTVRATFRPRINVPVATKLDRALPWQEPLGETGQWIEKAIDPTRIRCVMVPDLIVQGPALWSRRIGNPIKTRTMDD
jgi:hypothetical protein